jgi:DNA replication protein DnaC
VSSQAAQICSDCGGTGWQKVLRDGVEGVVRCECVKTSRADRLLEHAKVPLRYAHCELDNFDPLSSRDRSIEKAKLIAEKFVEEYPMSPPFGLLFMGPQGVGKTHLAVGILKRLMREKSVESLFCTFPELLKEIQNSYNPISQASELSLLAPVLETEVLVLDELGAQNPSSWVRDTVGYVLNYRYNENKVTLLTTNYKDEEEGKTVKVGIADTLTERIGPRMRSRLFEMCKTIKMDGNDFRKAVKQAEHHF